MTINEVMLRDMMEAEKQERENERLRDERGARHGSAIVKWGCVAGGVLAAAAIALLVWCCVSDAAHVFNISR